MQDNVLGMKVSGNIISELSDRIPNNFMALNELIKNSYDADATHVKISLLTPEKNIIVQDDGCGMDRQGMENLLHIARSNKNYAGRRSNGRITQGEKGLGALATFHFGNNVTWETSQDGKSALKFSIQKSNILDKEDISEYQTTITELEASFKGTKILIDDISVEEFDFIVNTLNDKKITSKLIRSLFDSKINDSFSVNVFVDGNSCINKEDMIVTEDNNRERIYRVEYDSAEDKEIKFFYQDTLVFKESFILDSLLGDFEIKCALNIYDLGGKVSSAHFPALYLKEQERKVLTPLVYINQGFFKNYTLFDTDFVRSRIKADQSLPQITGEIEIYTQSGKLMFNADRTEINENTTTAKLKVEIERLNTTIQKIGAKYKKPFVDMNRDRLPKDIISDKNPDITGKDEEQIKLLASKNVANEVYAKLTKIEILDDKVIYSFFGKKIEVKLHKQKHSTVEQSEKGLSQSSKDKNDDFSISKNSSDSAIYPVQISLKEYETTKVIGETDQLDLYDFIVQEKTKDSTGSEIPRNAISISCDSEDLMETESILTIPTKPRKVTVTYTYNDNTTGYAYKTLTISFIKSQSAPMQSDIRSTGIIHTHGIGNFEVSFNLVVSKLVKQINSLEIDNYSEVIACSLRTLFELGVNEIRNTNSSSQEFNDMKNSVSTGGLENSVLRIIEFVASPKKCKVIENYLNSRSCTNVSFHTLKNITNAERISKNAGESNLGAHKGTTNLSQQQVEDIANSASAFLIFVEGIIGAADNF